MVRRGNFLGTSAEIQKSVIKSTLIRMDCIIIIIIIIIITSETGITIYNYKSHRKLVNVKRLKKKKISVYKFKA